MNYRGLIVLCVALSACAPKDGQNQYKAGEVGISHSVEFGTVLNVREVAISGKSTGIGTIGGAAVGAGAGSYVGNGSGNIWATAGAAVIGAVAGTVAEQAITDHTGWEYVVHMQSGDTKTIVQEKVEGDVVFKPGDYVMLQYCDTGEKSHNCTEKGYQRLLPVAKLPPYVKNKHKYVNYHSSDNNASKSDEN